MSCSAKVGTYYRYRQGLSCLAARVTAVEVRFELSRHANKSAGQEDGRLILDYVNNDILFSAGFK